MLSITGVGRWQLAAGHAGQRHQPATTDPTGERWSSAVLMRQASVQLARPDGSPGQTLAGEFIDTGLAPDGAVTRLLGRDNVRVTLPAIGRRRRACRRCTPRQRRRRGRPRPDRDDF